MTDDQYRQLVDFLGERFGQIDTRFAQIDTRFMEVHREIAEVRRDLSSEIQQLAENVERRFVQSETRIQSQFEETRALIRLGYADLDRRVRRLEGG